MRSTALAPTKRGADLAVSLERLAAQANRDPCRVGLSATCRPDRARGTVPGGAVADLPRHRRTPPRGTAGHDIAVETLLSRGRLRTAD